MKAFASATLSIMLLTFYVAGGFSLRRILRGLTTNEAKLDDSSTDPLLQTQLIKGSPSEITDKIASWAKTQSQWEVVDRSLLAHMPGDAASVSITLTRTTGIFRFVDDIKVELTPEQDMTRVYAESKSRIGKGDLGQNPKNLRELTRAIHE